MKRDRLKILICGEASFLDSGYAVYQHRLLTKLSQNPAFHVAEQAGYSCINDPRDTKCNWRFYANAVRDNDPRIKLYQSNTQNSFGKWRFDAVVADFRPDVVIDIRDFWMNSFQRLSPLRECFHWVLMPTIDSMPQKEEWIDTYMNCDAIFTYSDWARDVLNNQSFGQINYIDTCSPGYDSEFFEFTGATAKKASRNLMGISDDSIIIGTVMRNQKRKLFAELIRDFRKLLDHLKAEGFDQCNNIFLYLHTSYPDFLCWDIPDLLRECRVLNKTLFTYKCEKCSHIQSCLYSGPMTLCNHCKQKSASMPTVSKGVTRQQLGLIYSLFDMYVQYSICEGFGMPQIEAASCGVPVMAVNYSAMEDVIKKLDAYPIDLAYKFRELETFADRAYPSSDSFIRNIKSYLSLDETHKQLKSISFAHGCYKQYQWDHSLDKWEKYLMSLYNNGYKADYRKPRIPISPITKHEINSLSNNTDIIRYMFDRLAPFNLKSYTMLDMLNRINYGYVIDNGRQQNFNIDMALRNVNVLIDNYNYSIELINSDMTQHEDYIQYANMKDPI